MADARALIRPTLLDRAIGAIAPGAAVRRLQARAFLSYIQGNYTGARFDRRATKDWNPAAQSPDADTIGDLPTLRARSADLIRNTPLASGAVKTVCTNVVGTGLTAHPKVDAEVLGLSEGEARDWNRRMKRIFRTIASTKSLDIAGKLTFVEMQHQALYTTLERGDVLIVRRANQRRNALTTTAFQLVEADRLCNPLGIPDRDGFAAGLETDDDGAILRYHVASSHPLEITSGRVPVWKTVPGEGDATGLPLAWLMAWTMRPAQTRGVPYLATVIEALKQIDRYGEAELMAAVIGAMFTLFVKSPHEDLLGASIANGTDPLTGKTAPPDYRLGPGAIGRLLPGEDISIADPKRPNPQFQPFVQAWAEQAGVALELPYEIFLKHFTSSYSAARGAQLEAWRFFYTRREWEATSFCHPVYEAVVAEAVAREWIEAPGFFDDPWVRLAYTRALWVGPEPGQIDPRVEVDAAKDRMDAGLSTLEEETYGLTGGDWEENHRQQVIERRMREQDGLSAPVVPGAIRAPGAADLDARDAQETAATARQRGVMHVV